jgi:NTE family protein
MKTIDRQVRALRRSLLIRSYQEPSGGPGFGLRRGAYWGVRTSIADYKVADALPCPSQRTEELAATPTRLWRMKELTRQRLVNWGYAVADAAVRAHYRAADPPTGFPYPKAKV